MSPKPTNDELDLLLDLRVRERNVTEGLLKQDDLQSHLDALPDSEEIADWVDLPSMEASGAALEKKGTPTDEDDQDELLSETV